MKKKAALNASSVLRISNTRSDKIFDAVNYIVMTLIFIVEVYPLFFMLIASFSDPNMVNAGKVFLWPRGWMLDGYKRIFSISKIWLGYRNTAIYTIVGCAISVSFTLTGGYALAQSKLPGNKLFMGLFTFTMFFSGGLIPTYLVVRALGLLDSIWAMTLPGAVSVWNLIIARTFFKTNIPKELEEAAEMDSCSQLGFFFRIALPLTKALIAIMFLFYMVGYWNEYFKGIIYMKTATKYPLQLILRDILITNTNNDMVGDIRDKLQQQKTAELLKYGVIIVSTLPLLIAYPFVQKFFVQGVLIGSLKG